LIQYNIYVKRFVLRVSCSKFKKSKFIEGLSKYYECCRVICISKKNENGRAMLGSALSSDIGFLRSSTSLLTRSKEMLMVVKALCLILSTKHQVSAGLLFHICRKIFQPAASFLSNQKIRNLIVFGSPPARGVSTPSTVPMA